MSSKEPLVRLQFADTSYVAAAVLEADFDARWAAWVAQGHAREEIARRKLGMFGGVLAIAGAVLYAFLR